jgi:hypothetical protein
MLRSMLSRLTSLGLLALLALGAAGCAKRLVLTPDELTRVEKTEGGIGALRVYPSDVVVILFREGRGASYEVNRTIREASSGAELEVILSDDTPGKVIAREERNGEPLLWVTFDASCRTPACAYGFILSEDNEYRLAVIPPKPGYKDPEVYFEKVAEKKRLMLGKVRSLAEANDVYVRANDKGAKTIDLVVKKKTDSSVDRKTRRVRGVD